MNFRKRTNEEPEINLIPFIDVLLVVLIFLMLSTTYSKFTEMQIVLPSADTETQKDYPKELIVAIAADGSLSVNRTPLVSRTMDSVTAALADAAKGSNDSVVIISADASAKHQSVISVMEAARRAGLNHITFATQTSAQAGTP
jgi:biopolymer transport protein ExbD